MIISSPKHLIDNVTVIGKKNQTMGSFIQPSDRKKTLIMFDLTNYIFTFFCIFRNIYTSKENCFLLIKLILSVKRDSYGTFNTAEYSGLLALSTSVFHRPNYTLQESRIESLKVLITYIDK